MQFFVQEGGMCLCVCVCVSEREIPSGCWQRQCDYNETYAGLNSCKLESHIAWLHLKKKEKKNPKSIFCPFHKEKISKVGPHQPQDLGNPQILCRSLPGTERVVTP